MRAFHVDAEDGAQAADVALIAWRAAESEFAKGAAYVVTFVNQVGGPDEAVEIFGEDLAVDVMNWLEDGKRLYRVSRMLDRKQAALLLYEDEVEAPGVMRVGIIDMDELPEGAELAGWPIVIIGAGIAIGALLVYSWALDVDKLREENKRLALQINEKLADIAVNNPALAERLMKANGTALEAQASAASDPGGALNKIFKFGKMMAAGAIPWGLIALAWYLSGGAKKGRKKNPSMEALPMWALFSALSGNKTKKRRGRRAA